MLVLLAHRRRSLLTVLTLTALLAAACGGSDSGGGDSASTKAREAQTASEVGVTTDTIKIGVAVSDLDGLRAGGISLPAALTTKNLSSRITSYFDEWNAVGGIDGRMIEPVVLTWDPTKPATQEQMCAQATVDNELFAVINATGLNNKTVDCLLDAGMLMYFGDFAAQASHDSKLLLTIAPPVEIGAEAGTRAAIESGDVPTQAKVGVLAGNGPDQKAGAVVAKAVLEEAGNSVQLVEINTLQGDVGAINQEAGAAAGTLRAGGVSTVLMLLNFTNQAGFFDAAGGGFKVTVLDTSASNCTAFGASRTPTAAIGGTCITTWDSQSSASGGPRSETPFEKECRAHWDRVFAAEFPTKSSPGVPSGQVITLADGTQLSSDYDSFSCTIANVFKLSMEEAGANPTRASAYEAALGLADVPVAMASDGNGNYGQNKSYLADFLHPVKLTAASLDTPVSANGTYNGCVAPVNCWVPNSDQWFPITR